MGDIEGSSQEDQEARSQSIFNEKVKEGINSLPVTQDDWEELTMIIDSGASVP